MDPPSANDVNTLHHFLTRKLEPRAGNWARPIPGLIFSGTAWAEDTGFNGPNVFGHIRACLVKGGSKEVRN